MDQLLASRFLPITFHAKMAASQSICVATYCLASVNAGEIKICQQKLCRQLSNWSKHAGWRHHPKVRLQCGVKVHMEGRRSPNIVYNISIICMGKNTALYCFPWNKIPCFPPCSYWWARQHTDPSWSNMFYLIKIMSGCLREGQNITLADIGIF